MLELHEPRLPDLPLRPIAEMGLKELERIRLILRGGSVIEWRGAKLINDCYNSNPLALNAMVDALMSMPAKRHIVLAGEMLELGPASPGLHAACGRHMLECGVDQVVGVRGDARQLAESAGGIFLETPAEARDWLRENVQEGDAVLLKASRGVKLEGALADL